MMAKSYLNTRFGQLGQIGMARGNSGTMTPYQVGNMKYVYDMYRTDCLFQDKNGTIPVTAYGQSIGLQLDLSGNGNHRFSESAARPTYIQDANGKPCFSYNGIGKFMQTHSSAWGSNEVCVVAGVRKLSDATRGIFAEFGPNTGTSIGTFFVGQYSADISRYQVGSNGGALAYTYSESYAAPHTSVVSLKSKILTDLCKLYINGAEVASASTDQGTGNYGTYAMYFGARAGTSLFFTGNEYSSCAFNKLLTDSQFSAVNQWVNNKTGAY